MSYIGNTIPNKSNRALPQLFTNYFWGRLFSFANFSIFVSPLIVRLTYNSMTLTSTSKRSDIISYVEDALSKGKTPYIIATGSGSFKIKLNFVTDESAKTRFTSSYASLNTSVKFMCNTCVIDTSSLALFEYNGANNSTTDVTSAYVSYKLYY